jgi:hypothetical protein
LTSEDYWLGVSEVKSKFSISESGDWTNLPVSFIMILWEADDELAIELTSD